MLPLSDFSREVAEPAEQGTSGEALALVNNRINEDAIGKKRTRKHSTLLLNLRGFDQ
jgi:hypothetical protein